MASADPGESFLTELENRPPEPVEETDSQDVPDEEDFEDDASAFTTATIEGGDEEGISDENEPRPSDERGADPSISSTQNGAEFKNPATKNTIPSTFLGNAPINPQLPQERDAAPPIPPEAPPPNRPPPIPKGRSIAHPHIKKNKVAFVSFDIETGGEYCGILQISAELVRVEVVRATTSKGESVTKDHAGKITRDDNTFNKYVKPEEGAIFDDNAVAVHGLYENHPSIVSADNIATVWAQFLGWFYSRLEMDEVAVLVAYNGETCDLKWLWKLTQAPRSPHTLPDEMLFFLDPMKVVKQYTGCKLNAKHSKIDSYELGVVWQHITGSNLNGAHDSLVDAKAQSDILVHQKFVPFINRSNSIQPIDEIFSNTQTREWKKEMESIRPVHAPWIEVTKEQNITWEPTGTDSYTGSGGGGDAAPSSAMQQAVRNADSLATIFFFIVPMAFFIEVARLTEKYCYKDWVLERFGTKRDGEKKKVRRFVDCPPMQGREPYPGRQHRADKIWKKFKVTPGFVLSWIAMLILQGAHFGADKHSASKLWRQEPYGVSIPYMQNAMTRNAYVFMRSYIHFADNSRRVAKGSRGYDPLFKVRFALSTFMDGMRRAWTAGRHVTVDESMIKYMGRAISYVQYMPAKPIKHGIKVFALCCAVSAVIIAFKVYVGKEETNSDGSAVGICDGLVKDAGITTARGRTLYTDNFYTSVKLAIHMYEEYGWTIVGTITPTDKKAREDLDIPFLKLSNGARLGVKRGWFREAVVELKSKTGKTYYLQCTTWRDKKQVCFLHNSEVGYSDGFSVKRHVKGVERRVQIDGPRAQAEYVKFFNAVDRNDRDSADWSTSIRTNRYYLRIFCWVLDRVVHTCYVVVIFSIALCIGPSGWKKYDKNFGRHDFQVDLGIALLNAGIEYDVGQDGGRPDYMRTGDWVPCNCKKCYFCLNGYTSGIAHAGKKRRDWAVVQYKCGSRKRTRECSEERVDLGKGASYCRMCYRTQDKKQTVAQK